MGSFFQLDQLPRDRRVQIALAGRSNVGKSSLLNKLVGRKKMAKVSTTPGKTRSLNFFIVNEKFYLVDLPGYGYAKVSRSIRESWGKMIEDYLNQSSDLIGLFLLLDCRREPTAEDVQLLEWLAERQIPTLVVITKADKLSRDKINRKRQQVEKALGVATIAFSTLSGEGKAELVSSVLQLVEDN
ncbi:MAG: ribosome biogenesis GTP-binding protein YihA/YsxC [bacterium]|nr:ribosome biogenesis GTP-binding protein YihA/YsxC [bacterium]